MSSLDGNCDSEDLPRIDEEVEEMIILGQPVQPVNNPDARPQSLSTQFKEMTEIVKSILKVLGHSERRHMSDNFMPH